MPSSDKGGTQILNPNDFEAIHDAVMETSRGRWFLSEYASRLRSRETIGMLDSMRRIEHAVSANHDALMARLAEAVMREAPASPPPVPQADLAPKHMKFFRQDEEIFEPAPQAKIAAVPDLPKPEPKPEVARGAKVVIRRAPENPAETETPKFEASPAADFLPSPPPPPSAEPPPAPQAEAAPKRRIVIIRHKPGEEIDVPLQNEMVAVG